MPGGPSSDRSQAKGTRHLHSMQYIENSDIHIYSGFFKILHELNIRVSVQKKLSYIVMFIGDGGWTIFTFGKWRACRGGRRLR